MEPADSTFCEVILLVRCAVEDRAEAADKGGRFGEALQRVAAKTSRLAGRKMAEITASGVFTPGC